VQGNLPLPEAITLIRTRTWQLAKRQLTWFRREPQVNWIEIGREELPLDTARRILQGIQHDTENHSVS
jgi:tRNA dimethylallyltransferase